MTAQKGATAADYAPVGRLWQTEAADPVLADPLSFRAESIRVAA